MGALVPPPVCHRCHPEAATNPGHVPLRGLGLIGLNAAADVLMLTPDGLRALLRRHPGLAEVRFSPIGRGKRIHRVLTRAEVERIGLFLVARCLTAYPRRAGRQESARPARPARPPQGRP